MINHFLNQEINYFEIQSDFHINFLQLAINDENQLWKQIIILNGKPTINFQNQQSLIKLTKAVMKQIFDIQWSIDKSNLCPRIPNRINYLIWIYKFILPVKKNQLQRGQKNEKSKIKCLDIGTGSSLIYPLLGWKIFEWQFLASQISNQSIKNCLKLIQQNKLQQKITILKGNPQFILKTTLNQQQKIKFVICNPPFFDSQQNFVQPLGEMKNNQHNIQGGQYQFFFKLYTQSFYFLNIQYFTMMLGLKKDFDEISKFLEIQYSGYNILQFIKFGQINQGNNARFMICWKVRRNYQCQLLKV